jgi:predicted lipoprotein with Yx(FWY)xxD motif
MRLTRRRALGATATTLALAGCLGDDGGDAGETEEPTETAEGSGDSGAQDEGDGTAAGDGSATVQVRSHPDHGEILVGPDGMTLYLFDQDTQGDGASACTGSCADNWPPLTAEDPAAGDGVVAELTTFGREDGTTQVAANGWPLYYFAADAEPGDAEGQGVGDMWWVVAPDGTPVRPDDGGTETEGETTESDGGTTEADPYGVA